MTIVTDQLSTIDPQRVRDVMSKVPTSVTVVAGQPELTGERAAMIVGSFVFVSLEPCLVGFFVGHESTSWPLLNKATVLGISTLASTQTQFCRKLGKKDSRPLRRTLLDPRGIRRPASHWFGCIHGMPDRELSLAVGDHDFVLTRVLGLGMSAKADPALVPQSQLLWACRRWKNAG